VAALCLLVIGLSKKILRVYNLTLSLKDTVNCGMLLNICSDWEKWVFMKQLGKVIWEEAPDITGTPLETACHQVMENHELQRRGGWLAYGQLV
jgi:hypothetical protein